MSPGLLKQDRIPWLLFLGAVLALRLVHLSLLGSVTTGMNPKIAAETKALIHHGFGQAYIDVPPAPVLLLAAMARIGNAPPGHLLPAILITSHLALAVAFAGWVRALRLSHSWETTSLALFVFLPINNSYEGFDNFPVLLAAAGFFTAMGLFHRLARQPRIKVVPVVACVLASASILLFRSEYLVYLPLYFLLFFAQRAAMQHARPAAREWLLVGAICVSLGGGALAVMTFQFFESGQFTLAPGNYACWTFLDGTPAAWLSPGDRSEPERVARGIERFGHPAEYDYSLLRMMADHPGATALKFVFNLPRWMFELGRRHVAAPLPLAVLALLGVAEAWRRRGGSDQNPNPLPILLATILMTLPLALLMVYAEYMLPAYGALCVLAAGGLLQALSFIQRRLLPERWESAVRWAAVAAACLALELFLVRGGGLLRDAVSSRGVVHVLDQRFAEAARPVVLDPYSYIVDCQTRADVRNRWLYHVQGKSEYGFEVMTPLAAATSPAAESLHLHDAAMWTEGDGRQAEFQARLEEWRAAGFQIRQTETVPDEGRTYTVILLRRAKQP